MKFVKLLISVSFVICASQLSAQDNTHNLADIRTELDHLSSQIQGLRSELVESGATGGDVSGGNALQRVDAIESELRVLTGQIEELQFRIEQIAKDATNRVGDLEFRLTELEGGDPSSQGQTAPLGGSPSTRFNVPSSIEMTVSEKGDFEAAKTALDTGDHVKAAELFQNFNTTYPGGPLSAQALYFRGEALFQLQDWKNAGRSFLDSFSSFPNGQVAPNALYWLGVSLSKLDKTTQACKTLTEVEARFPGHDMAISAQTEMQVLACL